jgi:hypothetical protein
MTTSRAAVHLREAHGVGGATEDRFGLRDAVPDTRRPPPAPPRVIRQRAPVDDEYIAPAPRAPLPPGTAILRLICADLLGEDLTRLERGLTAQLGVESVAIDLYAGIIDLFIDPDRATPNHLVAMAGDRLRLDISSAELHAAPTPGAPIGDATRLGVLF